MSLHYGYSGGGGTCGCCCSYSAESYNTAFSYGYSHYDWGDCGASCAEGNSANMNANVATAISRATDG